jgi:addiction module RelE/StbE family toxin
MKKYPVIWTPQAKQDLRRIKRYNSRDAPSTAKAFIRRIQERVRNIGIMPTAGSPVLEATTTDIREIFVGNYRIIYRVRDEDVRVLIAMHGAQLLTQDRLNSPDA